MRVCSLILTVQEANEQQLLRIVLSIVKAEITISEQSLHRCPVLAQKLLIVLKIERWGNHTHLFWSKTHGEAH